MGCFWRLWVVLCRGRRGEGRFLHCWVVWGRRVWVSELCDGLLWVAVVMQVGLSLFIIFAYGSGKGRQDRGRAKKAKWEHGFRLKMYQHGV